MKIAFFTEGQWSGKVDRNHPNMRTDMAWICALDATHYCLLKTFPEQIIEPFDIGIIIVPKKNPSHAFKFFERCCSTCKRWAVMQEGPNWYWQDYSIEDQIGYVNLLHEIDLILCHNEIDVRYYNGLVNVQKTFVMPSLMLEDTIYPLIEKRVEKRSDTVIGGNFVSWYGGFDSYLVAQEFSTAIFAPSMGRKQEQEDLLDMITYLPYMNWAEWMVELSKKKYAVHLMRTHAAGTFALNCAYLGIPCIGYKGLDTQEKCFPKLSVNVGDLGTARRIANHLKETPEFYVHVSEYAKKIWREEYHENVFKEKMKEILKYTNTTYL